MAKIVKGAIFTVNSKKGNGLIILGLDPGSRFAGFGVIEWTKNLGVRHLEHGVITISAKLNLANRLYFLSEKLEALFQKYSVDQMIIENIFVGKNVDSAFKLGHVRGVCLALAAKHKTEVHEIAARAAKKQLTGYGAANKDQMKMVVLNLLNISSEMGWDATDALALAICRSRQIETDNLLNHARGRTL